VLEEAFGGTGRVDTEEVLGLWKRVDGLARIPRLLARTREPAQDEDLRAFREILGRLYCAVATVSGASTLVDSSKYASYGLLLAGAPRVELRLLHLVRDSRAVAYSWRRRQVMPEVTTERTYMPLKRPWRSAVFWELENLGLELLRRSAVRSALLRYEDLTSNPRRCLSEALANVGVEADLDFLQRRVVHLGPNHTVAGNPLRFRRGEVTIEPDLEWRRRLDSGSRWVVTALTWPLLVRYGFRL
jgi:hypothetical protein